jgi:hypothetical protein
VCWICPESFEQYSVWSQNCVLRSDALARASKWQTCLYWYIECSFLLWQCAACSCKANTPNVNMWAQYHWYEAEIRPRTLLIALTRISRIRMRHEFADLLIKEKHNFQVVTARCSNCRPLCYYIVYLIVFLCKRPPESNWITLKMEAACSSEMSEQTQCNSWYWNPQNRRFVSIHSKSYWSVFLTAFYIYCSRLSNLWHVCLIQLGTSRSSGQHSASYVVGNRFKCLTKERIFWLRHLQTFVTRSGKIRELILH